MPHPILLPLLALLVACGTSYSPDTYATRAVQQANKVEQGTVIGRRDVAITAEGSTGAAAGAAAGGVVSAAAPGGGIAPALAGVGGALVGGLVGSAAEHAAGDTRAFEYVVRTGGGDLLSVTQRDTVPLAIGQKVLLIAGTQARIVPDYTTEPAAQRTVAVPGGAQGSIQGTPPAGSPAASPAGIPPAPPAPVLVPAPPPPPEAGADPVGQAVRARVVETLPDGLQPGAATLAREAAARP